MANIYQIRQEIADFEFECDPETGEILNALSWDALNMAFEEKVENIACYIKNLSSDINALTGGHNNGNVERAREAARAAEEEYNKFIQRLASNQVAKL